LVVAATTSSSLIRNYPTETAWLRVTRGATNNSFAVEGSSRVEAAVEEHWQ
jgi:hypothetical protein